VGAPRGRLDDQRNGRIDLGDDGLNAFDDHGSTVRLDQRLAGCRIAHPAQDRAFEIGIERDHLERLARRADPRHQSRAEIRAHRIDQRVKFLRALQGDGEACEQGLGVGKPDDLVGAVERGIDMFDCVLPTRSGRNGQAFTWNGPLNLRNARFAEDTDPLDAASDCPASRDYSRAYLHHLVKSGEMLGAMLLTEHNLAFYQALMRAMRDAIEQQRFAAFAAEFRRNYLGSSV